MPLYNYQCNTCQEVFEELENFDSPQIKNCPKCAKEGKKKTAKRLLSSISFVLKGRGWYKDGYSKDTEAQNG